MPWPKSTVPKFGNWDKSEDLSYSLIFDKARAEKERFLHLSEGDTNDILLEQNFYKNSSIGAGKKTPHSVYSGKARQDRESFLPTAQQDERYTHVHENIRQNPETTAGRGLSYVPDTKSLGLKTRVPGYNQPKSPSGVGVLPEQQNFSNVLPDTWNQSAAPANNSLLPSGTPSRHPLQMGTTKETALFKARQNVNQEDLKYQERLHAKSANTPRKFMYDENPASAKMRSSQGGLEVSRTADMRRKYVVPRFGDWESGEGFTAVFNKIRIEKSTKYSHNSTAKAISPLRPEEDLYKASITSDDPTKVKKRRRWIPFICCTRPSAHIVES